MGVGGSVSVGRWVGGSVGRSAGPVWHVAWVRDEVENEERISLDTSVPIEAKNQRVTDSVTVCETREIG